MKIQHKLLLAGLLKGLLLLVLGVVIFRNPFSLLYGAAMYLGVMALGSGAFGLYSVFNSSYAGNKFWPALGAGLDITMGLVMIAHLGLTVQLVPIIAGLWALAHGVISLFSSIGKTDTHIGSRWFAFSGSMTLALVGYLMLVYPYASIMTMSFFAGSIAMLMGALLMIGTVYTYFRLNMKAKERKSSQDKWNNYTIYDVDYTELGR